METPFQKGRPAALPDSLWAAITPSAETYPRLEANVCSDIGIIGGGFMGLAAALKLSAGGRSVSLLEASDIGWGASGRNNGLIAPGLKRDPHEIIALLGKDRGERLLQFSGNAASDLARLVKCLDIECDLNINGWIQAAHSRFAVRAITRRCGEWQKRGANVELIDNAKLEDRLGTRFYRGAWIDWRGGSLNPLAFVRGLARAAQIAGTNLYCGTPVTQILRQGTGWKLQSSNGSVNCDQVLICTNAYGQLPQTRSKVMPLRTAQVASEPLNESQISSILPGGEAASDTLRLLTSFRITADKRLIMGGASATAGSEHPALFRHLHRAAALRFPQLGLLRWQYGWSGYLALTRNHLPVLCKHDEGVYSAIGCNGRGIAMASAIGGLLANLLRGADEKSCAVPITPAKNFPGYALRQPGVAIAVHLNRALDKASRLLP